MDTLAAVSEPAQPLAASSAPVYLIATSGYPNFGDEFILASWLRLLARNWPQTEVWLDVPNPGLVTHLFAGLHPKLCITDNLWRLMTETEPLEPDEADAHIDAIMTHLGTPRYDLGLLDARRAGTIHLVGGGHMNALWPRHLRLIREAVRLHEVSGARLVATGLGLMPLHDREWLRELVGAFDHFSVRDKPSAEATGGELVGDDALLGLREIRGFRDAQIGAVSDEVWVNLQTDLASPDVMDAAVAAVRAALTSPEYAERPVHYLEGIPGVDRIAYDRLSDLIPEENFVPFIKLWKEGFPARPGQTWITSRFHFHLLAAACGAEGTAVVVHEDYYGVKHQSLLDAGTGWALNEPGSATLSPPSRNTSFRVHATQLHQAKVREAESLYPPVPAAPVTPPVRSQQTKTRSWPFR